MVQLGPEALERYLDKRKWNDRVREEQLLQSLDQDAANH